MLPSLKQKNRDLCGKTYCLGPGVGGCPKPENGTVTAVWSITSMLVSVSLFMMSDHAICGLLS